eukprot:TRINITY_DN18127_c0_g1_i1.p1 TRINITY_DN18127_c0_g1~~TRINITY_DN18127_c0_g1_i1.p1  ORF type:complete len:866 (-),score=215.98 TRINITY_DN18127_c0_g1_i1:273-2621(-)
MPPPAILSPKVEARAARLTADGTIGGLSLVYNPPASFTPKHEDASPSASMASGSSLSSSAKPGVAPAGQKQRALTYPQDVNLGSSMGSTGAGSPAGASSSDFAAAAEAALRDVDARLVEDIRRQSISLISLGGNVCEICGALQQVQARPRKRSPERLPSTSAALEVQELRAELRREQALALELEKKNSELYRLAKADRVERERLQAAVEAAQLETQQSQAAADALQGQLAAAEQESATLKKDLRGAELERLRLMDLLAEHQEALSRQRADAATFRRQVEAEREAHRLQLQEKERRIDALNEEKLAIEIGRQSFEKHHGASLTEQTRKLAELEVTVARLSRQCDSTQLELTEQRGGAVSMKARVVYLEQEIVQLESSRRHLHNAVQELKGNIRVCCRVRPQNKDTECALQCPGQGKLLMSHGGEHAHFNFDLVFGPDICQAEVFGEIEGLVQSALDGYKVCIFAYGPTGAGKTHTMLGTGQLGMSGLIPRSLHKIFQAAEAARPLGWSWTLQATFLEIYNESLRDLLRGSADAAAGGPCGGHVIVHDDAWGTTVTNMSCVEVTSIEQINGLMDAAMKQRAVGATDVNAVSSRSHSVFALYLKGTNKELGSELHGALHLVDLAGSERLSKTGSTGDRLKEACLINRSLSSLVDVFSAKAEGRTHVPFRNSKLTHLMEPCLSGQGKTLMLVHVGPECDSANEALCALRFAKQVSQCDTGGRPKRHQRTMATGKMSSRCGDADEPRSPRNGFRSPRRSSPSSYNVDRHRSGSLPKATRSGRPATMG